MARTGIAKLALKFLNAGGELPHFHRLFRCARTEKDVAAIWWN